MDSPAIGPLRRAARRPLDLLRRVLARRSTALRRAAEEPQQAIHAPGGGPPADWIERVRRGAPHLLLPGEPSRPAPDGRSGASATARADPFAPGPQHNPNPLGIPEPPPAAHPAESAQSAYAAQSSRGPTAVPRGRSARRTSLRWRIVAAAHAFAAPASTAQTPRDGHQPDSPATSDPAEVRVEQRVVGGESMGPPPVASRAAPTLQLPSLDSSAAATPVPNRVQAPWPALRTWDGTQHQRAADGLDAALGGPTRAVPSPPLASFEDRSRIQLDAWPQLPQPARRETPAAGQSDWSDQGAASAYRHPAPDDARATGPLLDSWPTLAMAQLDEASSDPGALADATRRRETRSAFLRREQEHWD